MQQSASAAICRDAREEFQKPRITLFWGDLRGMRLSHIARAARRNCKAPASSERLVLLIRNVRLTFQAWKFPFESFLAAVFDIASKLPNKGIGQRLTRKTWEQSSYWTVQRVQIALVSIYLGQACDDKQRVSPAQVPPQATQVKLLQDGRHGKAYGLLTWRGTLFG